MRPIPSKKKKKKRKRKRPPGVSPKKQPFLLVFLVAHVYNTSIRVAPGARCVIFPLQCLLSFRCRTHNFRTFPIVPDHYMKKVLSSVCCNKALIINRYENFPILIGIAIPLNHPFFRRNSSNFLCKTLYCKDMPEKVFCASCPMCLISSKVAI